MSDRVAVLGATGYVGQGMVTALLEAGWPVTLVVRHPPVAAPHGDKFAACDAGNQKSLVEAARDASQTAHTISGMPLAFVDAAISLAVCVQCQTGAPPSLAAAR